MLKNTEVAIKNDQSTKLATYGTQTDEKQNKKKPQYTLETTMHKQAQITSIIHEPFYK